MAVGCSSGSFKPMEWKWEMKLYISEMIFYNILFLFMQLIVIHHFNFHKRQYIVFCFDKLQNILKTRLSLLQAYILGIIIQLKLNLNFYFNLT